MKIDLQAENGLMKFDAHLPIYNWIYPVAGQETIRMDKDRLYGSIEYEHITSRAIYVHIPFCETICSFCPFIRGLYNGDEIVEAYTRALITEMDLKARYPSVTGAPIGAIFFGGGTPSLLEPEQIIRIGTTLRKHFDLRQLKEFSFEMEVKSVTREKLLAMKEIGVTHARFGLQTFKPTYRDDFTLTATLDQTHRATEMMNEILPFVSFDILYGIDGQTIEEFAEDIESAVAMKTTNIDFYPINNLVSQIRLHKSFDKRGLRPTSALQKFHMNMYLNAAIRELGFLPHNGHGYVRASKEEIARRPVVTDSYKFQYHEHVYGYYEQDLIGFGNSAISQTSHFGIRNLEGREDYIKDLLQKGTWREKVVEHPPFHEKGLAFRLPYHGSVEKRLIQWDRIPRETTETLDRFVAAKLVEETETSYRLTQVGWYWYVNLMFLLSPAADRAVLGEFIESRLNDPGRRDGNVRTLPLALTA